MRRILVEHAGPHNLKRGGGVQHVSLEQSAVVSASRAREPAALDEALNELSRIDPRKVRVVELRLFSGLSVEETAEALSISSVTVMHGLTPENEPLILQDTGTQEIYALDWHAP